MGSTYQAHLIVGVEISGPDALRTSEQVKAFEHDYPEDWVACPKTGRALWKTRYALKDGVVDGDDELEIGGDSVYSVTVGGLEVISYDMSRPDRYFIVATKVNAGDAWPPKYIKRLADFDVDAAYDRCRDALEPIGFWDESAFGVYLVQYVGG